MILYLAIFVIFVIASIWNLRKTIICWLPLQLLFNEGVCIRYSSPAVTLSFAITAWLLAFYFIKEYAIKSKKRKGKGKSRKEKFILQSASLAYLGSYCISAIFSIVPLKTEILGIILFFSQNFLLFYIFFKSIQSQKDISLFVKCLIVVFYPITALGIFEAVFKDNPWLDFVYLNCNSMEDLAGKIYYTPAILTESGEMGTRYGLVRCFSFFSIHISYGVTSVLVFFLLSTIYIKKLVKINQSFLLSGVICSLLGVFLCNSKTGLVGLAFFCAANFNYFWQHFNYKTGAAILFIILAMIFFMPSHYYDSFLAIFDSKLADEGGGSTTAMRIHQYEVGMKFFMDNPIIGSGPRAMTILSQKDPDILGSESIFLKILPQLGLVGLFAYFYLYINFLKYLMPVLGRNSTLLFLGGCMAMEIATPRSEFLIWISVITIILYKLRKFRRFASRHKKVKVMPQTIKTTTNKDL